jgi:hypothetical protein
MAVVIGLKIGYSAPADPAIPCKNWRRVIANLTELPAL